MHITTTKHLKLVVLAVVLFFAGESLRAGENRTIEGVYHLHSGYQSETVELREGRFRYWAATDYGLRQGPLEGTYTITGSKITFNRDDLTLGKDRVFQQLKGRDAIWQPYALQQWLATRELSVYGVLLKVPDPPADLSHLSTPSSRDLYELRQQ